MTDNEIIKALECCQIAYDQDCTECPLYPDDGEIACREVLREESLDLINRQQAEIDRLKTNLNVELDNFASEYDGKIKAEAYKEFARRLKEEIDIRPTHSNEQNKYVCFLIDNLVKEMAGE